MILNAVNTYTGKTIFDTQGATPIDRADVFGTSTTPIEIHNGHVFVNVLPEGDRGFAVKQGTLDVQVTDSPIDGDIFLGGGNATISGIGVFTGQMELTGEDNSIAAIRGGTFNGIISGAARQVILGGGYPEVAQDSWARV